PSFKMGGAVAQLFGLVAIRQANAAVIPYNVERYSKDLKVHFEQAVKNVKTIEPDFTGFDQVDAALAQLQTSTAAYHSKLHVSISEETIHESRLKEINSILISLEKSW